MKGRIFLVFLVFFYGTAVSSQDFSLSISDAKVTIDGKARAGFMVDFDYSVKDTEKGWWRYSRSFGRPLNMRGYYQVTIPSGVNSGNVDITLLSKTFATKKGARFFLALDEEGLPADKVKNYQQQVKVILKDFKKSYYITQLEERLEDVEKKAKKASKRVARAKSPAKEAEELTQLKSIQEELSSIKNQLKHIYAAE